MCNLVVNCVIVEKILQTDRLQEGNFVTPLYSLDSPVRVRLLYDWRFTSNQFVLASSLLRLARRDFFFN
jgi:hypothetical protein